ncbi:hypothetical protein ACS0TY_000182 [Phlomoides rotata]
MESPENSSPQETESSHEDTTTATTKAKIKNHPRRFTDDQIKSLESIFKKESKLDPRKKLQIARDLGLQPRQVAIWFQNKRARWKSKQIEQEYNVLRSNYDTLSLRFEDLKRENMSLEKQLRELSNLVKKSLEKVDSNDHRITEEIDHNDEKMIIGNSWEKREDQEFISWAEDEEELEISQTWHNLSSDVGLNSNWWES